MTNIELLLYLAVLIVGLFGICVPLAMAVLSAWMRGRDEALDAKVSAIQAVVERGTKEHEVWQQELSQTNERIDRILLILANQQGVAATSQQGQP